MRDYTNSEIIRLINEHIHNEKRRKILKDSLHRTGSTVKIHVKVAHKLPRGFIATGFFVCYNCNRKEEPAYVD